MEHLEALKPKHTAPNVKSTCVRAIAFLCFTHNPSANCPKDIKIMDYTLRYRLVIVFITAY